jgi:HEAT repeat protein
MRLRVIIPLLVLATFLGVSFCYLRQKHIAQSKERQMESRETREASAVLQDPATANPASTGPAEPALTNGSAIEVRGTVAEHETYVEKRVAELQDLAMDNDPKSLQVILSELTNRDPEIRQAAVDAAVQFGSRDAIPKLTDAASQTDDAVERAQMLQAADYLKLPSYRETLGDLPVRKPVDKHLRPWRAAPAVEPN